MGWEEKGREREERERESEIVGGRQTGHLKIVYMLFTVMVRNGGEVGRPRFRHPSSSLERRHSLTLEGKVMRLPNA